jgi:hypothetical protein
MSFFPALLRVKFQRCRFKSFCDVDVQNAGGLGLFDVIKLHIGGSNGADVTIFSKLHQVSHVIINRVFGRLQRVPVDFEINIFDNIFDI